MEWRDEGVILSVRAHGETSALADILTASRGRTLGLVRGGRSHRLRPMLQPGNIVLAHWRARLEEHLGSYTLEPLILKAGALLDEPFKLAGLATLTALSQLLPEREPHPKIYAALRVALETLDDDDVWPALLVRWEMGLLDELGFGLDLERCAATGQTNDLVYVSPKTGRAVSRAAGEAYKERLFPLPGFLAGSAGGGAKASEVRAGLQLTGHFLARHVFGPRGIAAPESRIWLLERLARMEH